MGLGIGDMEEELFSSWYSHDKPEYFQEIGRNNITEVFAVE
jgi:hypothetical protein